MGDENISIPRGNILGIITRLNIGGAAIHTILFTRHLHELGYDTRADC